MTGALVFLAVPLALLALVLLVGFSGCGLNSDPTGFPWVDPILETPGLVSYWHLNEPGPPVAADANGLHDGAYVSGPIAEDPADESAGAPGTLDFQLPSLLSSDPTRRSIAVNGARVEVDFTPDLNTPQFTVIAWVKTGWRSDDVAAYRAVLDSRDFVSGAMLGYAIFANPANEWTAWIGDGAPGNGLQASTGVTIALGTIDFLAMTFDGTTLKLYVNGEERLSVAAATYAPNAERKLYIGEGAPMLPTPFFPFVGLLEDVAYFKAALDHETIVTIGFGASG
ncbi:MAG: hypothetical protein QOE36_3064 [Gaiellaceae bacterium]|nr:hypothetical protein [Gaiellaceae bacterium]